MAQKVKFKRHTTAEIEELEVEDGALVYNIDNGKTYMDYGTERIQTGGNADTMIYIGDTQPTDTDIKLWINTPTSETKASEIVNEYTDSDKVGYSCEYTNDLQPVDITSHFSSSYNVNTLKAIYYPAIKKVEVTFFISQIPTSNDWTNFITIDDSAYYSASNVYDVCYSTNASAGAIGIEANSGYIRGYQKALFGGTLMYYVD